MKVKGLVFASCMVMFVASIAYAGPPAPPTPHVEVAYTQTIKDVRWVLTQEAIRNNVTFDKNNSTFTVISGSDALQAITQLYSNNDRWDSDVMIYVRQVLGNSSSKAIYIEDDEMKGFIYVPWNSLVPPTTGLPTGEQLVIQRGYIITINTDLIDSFDDDGCKNNGAFGSNGSGASCGCIQGLGCGTCVPCSEPPFIISWGSYPVDSYLFSSYSNGLSIPLYGN